MKDKPYNSLNVSKGMMGEDKAVSYLNCHGYTILARNFRLGKYTEVDIIAEKDEYICFIEVKTRFSNRFGYGREAINEKKRNKIRKAANMFMIQNEINEKFIRFDVVEVNFFNGINGICEVEYIENAF